MNLLKQQLATLEEAEHAYKAASAIDRHNSLKAKARIRRLLISPKGLSAAFSAGVVKGLSQSDDTNKSALKKTGAKQVLSMWLG